MNLPPRHKKRLVLGTGAVAAAISVLCVAGYASQHLNSQSISDRNTSIGAVCAADLPEEFWDTIASIEIGGPYKYKQDGTVFKNREGILPEQESSYYHEFTVDTPGLHTRGAKRIVTGGEIADKEDDYYTDDHYETFRQVDYTCATDTPESTPSTLPAPDTFPSPDAPWSEPSPTSSSPAPTASPGDSATTSPDATEPAEKSPSPSSTPTPSSAPTVEPEGTPTPTPTMDPLPTETPEPEEFPTADPDPWDIEPTAEPPKGTDLKRVGVMCFKDTNEETRKTLALIQEHGDHRNKFPYPKKDGSTFEWRDNDRYPFPKRPDGYYKEWTVPTPGADNRGAQRIVTGGDPKDGVEDYYTADHYRTFKLVDYGC